MTPASAKGTEGAIKPSGKSPTVITGSLTPATEPSVGTESMPTISFTSHGVGMMNRNRRGTVGTQPATETEAKSNSQQLYGAQKPEKGQEQLHRTDYMC